MDLVHIIDGVIGVLVLGFGYWASTLSGEVKRIEILLNRTREDYASRSEVSDQITRLSEAMVRLESKLDRVLEKK